MKIIITGDSHTAALRSGADMLAGLGDLPQDVQIDIKRLGRGGSLRTPFFIDRGNYAEMIDQTHQKRITRLPFSDEQESYGYYGICGPLHTIRLWRNNDYWQKYTPFTMQCGQAPVSTSLLRHIVLQDQLYIMQLVELLKRVGANVFVIEAPKPYRHHPILELVDPNVITHIDSFYRKVIRECLAALDVPVIDIPKACYDADGFMLDAFRHDNQTDGYHANKEFGAIMIKQIIEVLKPKD